MVTNCPETNVVSRPLVAGSLGQFQMPVVAVEVIVNPGHGVKTYVTSGAGYQLQPIPANTRIATATTPMENIRAFRRDI
jgi:hypothetical protein